MCMMYKNGEKESCEVAKNLAALDGRVGSLETRMDKMEGSLADGFKALSSAINTLGHDFGERMNIMEKKVVDEKAARKAKHKDEKTWKNMVEDIEKARDKFIDQEFIDLANKLLSILGQVQES